MPEVWIVAPVALLMMLAPSPSVARTLTPDVVQVPPVWLVRVLGPLSPVV